MSVFTRSSYGLLAIVMLVGSPGLLTHEAVSQEGHEEASLTIASEEASGDVAEAELFHWKDNVLSVIELLRKAD